MSSTFPSGSKVQAPTCEVCQIRQGFAVLSVPGVPYSASYCRECYAADAHPYGVLVANTAAMGGWEHSAPWWKEMVGHTLAHLKKTQEQFLVEVAADMKAMEEYNPEEAK